MGLFSRVFNKKSKTADKSSNPSNDNTAAAEDKKSILDSESIPAAGKGAGAGILAAGGGLAAHAMLVGALVTPLGIGFPILAGGAVLGAVTGGIVNSRKRKQKKQNPKGPSAG